MKMQEIRTKRLVLRPFRESDYDDLFEFLSQLEDDEFEGYPGINWENGREHLKYRLGSEEFYAMELTESGNVIGNIYCGNRDFEAKKIDYIVNKALSAAGLRRRSAFCGDRTGIQRWRPQDLRRMRSAERSLLEAAGEGGPAARGAFQAEYLVP
jgi:hypothetical protein